MQSLMYIQPIVNIVVSMAILVIVIISYIKHKRFMRNQIKINASRAVLNMIRGVHIDPLYEINGKNHPIPSKFDNEHYEVSPASIWRLRSEEFDGHLYTLRTGRPLMFEGFIRYGLNCTQTFIQYSNTEPTQDFPTGSMWFLPICDAENTLIVVKDRRTNQYI